MKNILILIKSKEKVNWTRTASDILKKYIEEDKGYRATRDYIGNVNYVFDSKNNAWTGYIRDKKLESYDLIHVQTAGVLRDQATLLTHYYIQNKIKHTEESFKNTASNSKLIQAMKLSQKGILIPKTIYLGAWMPKKLALRFPMVAKRILGSGGEGVFLVKRPSDLVKLEKNGELENHLFQEYIPNDFDWRVVVIGGKAVYSCKRIRQNKKEFRNNVKLGAKEVVATPSAMIKKTAVQAAKAMSLTIAGVDIVERAGKCYVIEVNRSPSFTKDLKISNEIPILGEYIKKCLNQK